MISDGGEQMWSAHLGGVIMSVWNAYQCMHVFDVDVGACAEKKCHIGNPQDRIMTAMCTALDTMDWFSQWTHHGLWNEPTSTTDLFQTLQQLCMFSFCQ